MSYILDALKKSEQERQRHTNPDIHTVHAAAEPRVKRRPAWPYLLSLALMANLGLMLWWLQPWQSPKTIPLAQTTPPVKEGHDERHPGKPDGQIGSTATNAPAVTASTSKAREPSPPKTEEPTAKASKASSVEDNAPSRLAANTAPSIPQAHREPAKPREPEPVQEKAPPKPELKRASEPPPGSTKKNDESRSPSAESRKKTSPAPNEMATAAVSPSKSNREPTLAELLSAHSAGRAVENGPAKPSNAGSSPSSPTDAPSEGKAGTVPETLASIKQRTATAPASKSLEEGETGSGKDMKKMHQLPQAVRKDLPNISFSMFIYSEDPAKRLVSYNGRVIREGQEMAPGLKLERITRSGVVLNFRGHRFEKEEF